MGVAGRARGSAVLRRATPAAGQPRVGVVFAGPARLGRRVGGTRAPSPRTYRARAARVWRRGALQAVRAATPGRAIPVGLVDRRSDSAAGVRPRAALRARGTAVARGRTVVARTLDECRASHVRRPAPGRGVPAPRPVVTRCRACRRLAAVVGGRAALGHRIRGDRGGRDLPAGPPRARARRLAAGATERRPRRTLRLRLAVRFHAAGLAGGVLLEQLLLHARGRGRRDPRDARRGAHDALAVDRVRGRAAVVARGRRLGAGVRADREPLGRDLAPDPLLPRTGVTPLGCDAGLAQAHAAAGRKRLAAVLHPTRAVGGLPDGQRCVDPPALPGRFARVALLFRLQREHGRRASDEVPVLGRKGVRAAVCELARSAVPGRQRPAAARSAGGRTLGVPARARVGRRAAGPLVLARLGGPVGRRPCARRACVARVGRL